MIVWSVADREGRLQCEPETEFNGHGGPVYSAAFSPDGLHVASAGYDGRVMTWNPADVKPVDLAARIAEVADLSCPIRRSPATAASWRLLPNGRLIAIAGPNVAHPGPAVRNADQEPAGTAGGFVAVDSPRRPIRALR